jgi:hypothetical protein
LDCISDVKNNNSNPQIEIITTKIAIVTLQIEIAINKIARINIQIAQVTSLF